ncbi:helix-turn-helix transcriptional regulator [Actinomycetospora atypica]|uniref:LuxR C-terminal-related transcriptional regulator n=1 Tax=Actinomycetospora atypica TaxID=1290095 RepID=A0ABV9YJZ5_9PSEU
MGRTCVVHDERDQAGHRLTRLLRAHGDVDEVVVAADAEDLLGLARSTPAALVVLGLPRSGAAELVGTVLAAVPGVPVLVAGPSDEPALVAQALAAGAAGYLRWDAPRAMTRTLTRVAVGGDPLWPVDDEMRVDRGVQQALDLSAREIQVLVGVSRGLTNADIGRRLYLSAATVKSHVARLFPKLGATDRAEAVGRAWQVGLFVRPR